MSRREDNRAGSAWIRWLAISVMVPALIDLIIQVLSTTWNNTRLVRMLQAHWTYVTFVVSVIVVLAFGLYVYVRWREVRARRQVTAGPADPPVRPQPQELQPWFPLQVRLRGRDREIDQALGILRARGLVVLAGPRDVGTSSVANAVVARLLDDGVISGPEAVVWVDLRGRSTAQPPDARAVAGRLLSTFNLDEPADGTPGVLRDAAARLMSQLRARETVLLLDNVFHAEQVDWLTSAWHGRGVLPMLVIAGDRPVARPPMAAVVSVEPLSMATMRTILSDALDDGWLRRLAVMLRGYRRDDQVDQLLRRLDGCPGTVGPIAQFIRLSGGRPRSLTDVVEDTGVEPLIAVWSALLPHLISHRLSERAQDLIRVLAVLPVTGLGRDVLVALQPQREPGQPDAVDELLANDVVRESPPGRFRLPEEVRLVVRRQQPQPVPHEVWAAVGRLVRYYAELAETWAAALDSAADAQFATIWLHQEEPLLRALLTDWRPDARPPESLVDDFAVVADALHVWYVRELQSDGLERVSRGLATLAAGAGRDDLVRLAELRAATAHRIGTRLDLADRAIVAAAPEPDGRRDGTWYALRARWHNERGLIELDRANRMVADPEAATDRLQAAEREFGEALSLVPEDDLAARACIELNLGATHIELGRLDTAYDFLGQVAGYADGAEDVSVRAHAMELRGVGECRGEKHELAVDYWQRALGLYRELGEEQGQARCLAHLGRLALTRPEIAGLLETGHAQPFDARRAAQVAYEYLLRSNELRAGQPNSEEDEYLAAAQRLMRTN